MIPQPRVLVAAPVFPPMVGGAELLAYEVASNLRGFDVRVVTLGHPRAEDQDLAVIRTRLPSGARHSLKALNARVLYEAARFSPDIVLSQHVAVTPAALSLQLLGVPFVQYAHAKEFAHYSRAARIAMQRADATIAVSRYTATLAMEAGAPDDRVHVILPGVDKTLISGPRGPRSSPPTLVTVSRLDDAYKGHDVILRALPLIQRNVRDASWVVIGDGQLRRDLERAAASLPDGAVRVLGRVSDAERDEWLDCAAVFVLPSRIPEDLAGGEGFGIAALEASARGVPVVAGEHGGTADAVVDGETGLLVDASRPEAVAEAVLQILNNPEEAQRMGEAGRTRAKGLSWERVGAEVAEVLRHVLR